MTIIDDRTPVLNLALPNENNALNADVARLRSALTALDTASTTKADLVGGKVPAGQLPSYVDDVLEVTNFAGLPVTGESGKIYVTQETPPKQYRWSGSVYVKISDLNLATGSVDGLMPAADKAKLDGVTLGLLLDPVVVSVASNGDTVFTVPSGYTAGSVMLFKNGSKLLPTDYTATNGTTITVAVAALVSDQFEVVRVKRALAA